VSAVLKPHGLDFSNGRAFPAVVEIVLGSGHKFASACTDAEAQRIIKQLSEWAASDAPPDDQNRTGRNA